MQRHRETIISQSTAALGDMAVEPDAGAMVSLLKEARGLPSLSIGGQSWDFLRGQSMERD